MKEEEEECRFLQYGRRAAIVALDQGLEVILCAI